MPIFNEHHGNIVYNGVDSPAFRACQFVSVIRGLKSCVAVRAAEKIKNILKIHGHRFVAANAFPTHARNSTGGRVGFPFVASTKP
jgi:hypothetical protein